MQDDPHTTGADGIECDESHADAGNPTEPAGANESRVDDREPPPEDEGSGDVDDDRAEADPEPLAYRLERLRLWRTLVTLAVVVARLIRSL